MLSLNNINKRYGDIDALCDISLEVKSGEIMGIIGPDGSGKSTMMRILATLIVPDSGSAYIDGIDVVNEYKKVRGIVGYMPGRFSLYKDLTVGENLKLFATVFGTTVTQNYDLIRDIYVQIEPFNDRKANDLSGGMKQKLALCCALIHRPQLLILDEPTTGVDPVSRREFWDMLKRLNGDGMTIMVSTPYMDEASACTTIALMQGGKILTKDAPSKIVSRFGKRILAIKGENMFSLLKELRGCDFTHSIYSFGDEHHLVLKDGEEYRNLFNDFKNKRQKSFMYREILPQIEDCYMDIAGNNLKK